MMSNTITAIILFIILLSCIVSVHELGHLIAAKIFNVYCKEYAIGMGPKLYSHQFKETEFSIRAFPIGGFVSMAGEPNDYMETQVDTSELPIERTLNGIAKWKRIIVMLSGIFMNLILAIVIYSLIILGNGAYAKDSKPTITGISENTPACESELMVGDIIYKIELDNGASITPKSYTEISVFTIDSYDGNGPWRITVKRNEQKKVIEVTPKYNESEGRYLIGIEFSNAPSDIVKVNIFNCWIYGFDYCVLMLRIIFNSLMTIIRGVGIDKLSGPVGIYKSVETSIEYGPIYYLQLIALISLNVGAFNALPLPIFDGGRVFLTIIEYIVGKPLDKKTEELVMKICFALILSIFIYVSFNDVIKLLRG